MYKVGDRVKHTEFGEGIILDADKYDKITPYFVDCDGESWWCGEEDLQFLTKTLDNLEVGDVLVDKDGYEKMILGICGRVYFLSIARDFEEANTYPMTIQEIKKFYTLKGSEKSDLLLKAEELEKQAKEIREKIEEI